MTLLFVGLLWGVWLVLAGWQQLPAAHSHPEAHRSPIGGQAESNPLIASAEEFGWAAGSGGLARSDIMPKKRPTACRLASHCKRDGDLLVGSSMPPVCGSNGQLFGSICQLERFACVHNPRLAPRPAAYCSKPADNNTNHSAATADYNNEPPSRSKLEPEVRVVQLRESCRAPEYEQMKWLLASEFNMNLSALFKHFDSNQNELVEAHELWPATSGRQERKIYAQLWNNHLVNCPSSSSSGLLKDHSNSLEQLLIHHQSNRSPAANDCWYELDFAFEPRFPPNPCSLSHLVLFEAAANTSGFSRIALEQVFARQLDKAQSVQATSSATSMSVDSIRRRRTRVTVRLGATASLSCLDTASHLSEADQLPPKCLWSRHGVGLASIRDPHLSWAHQDRSWLLEIRDAQLYLSGAYKCVCKQQPELEHMFELEVMAEPRVEVRPQLQWALEGSSATFECFYDFIDTRVTGISADRRLQYELPGEKSAAGSLEPSWSQLELGSNKLVVLADEDSLADRVHLSAASSRLRIDRLTASDSGSYVCALRSTTGTGSDARGSLATGQAQLRVQAERPSELNEPLDRAPGYLWVFHEHGISVYRLPADDGQEMELAREMSGHSQVSGRLDGNWNQLTLCGGLNPEQVVICEWSDNALHLEVPNQHRNNHTQNNYIYVGQPNLNRVLVLDGQAMEIIAIINTEPQPRRLFQYRPNRVHLSKWVRRKLAPHRKDYLPDDLLQLDVWLLCYGQPLVVDPADDEPSFELALDTADDSLEVNSQLNSSRTAAPFKPHLSAWPVWANKEWRLRNRKSVHIIQSTFFVGSSIRHDDLGPIERFKASTVLTTHHILAGPKSGYFGRLQQQFDLIQDLWVPERPAGLETDTRHKLHQAYVSHYDEHRLFRVSMDEYRYERELDLQDCDPLHLVSTGQGLLVVQCRAPISHQLTGQLVLDQLSSSRLQFNEQVRAQQSYLSPDNRYLVSVFSNFSASQETPQAAGSRSDTDAESNSAGLSQSLIYVQLVTVDGLRFQYQIRSSLEVQQCSFVWRDGYYAAVLLSTNHQDDQSELLSLRLADSRLELLARLPGKPSASRHKDQILVHNKLRLAALATSRGTFVVDLEDNRVVQSLRRHQSPPTMLWL